MKQKSGRPSKPLSTGAPLPSRKPRKKLLGVERGVHPGSGRFSQFPTEKAPGIDLNQYMDDLWGGTKVRVEATIDHELYTQIQDIINRIRKLSSEGDFPIMSISHIVEMLLRKGVKAYLKETRDGRKPLSGIDMRETGEP